jgi:hypothetical protein
VNTPASDVTTEARRLLVAIDVAQIPARILGGVAVGLHAHTPLPPALERKYADIDFVVGNRREGDLQRVLVAAGYEADRKFNALYGHKRQLYWDRTNDRQLDVFVGRFAMCHALPLDGRLADPSGTLLAADLLLTKLQVVELNPKDVVDALALIDQHSTGSEADGDVIGLDRIAAITGADWGWFTTASDTLDRLEDATGRLDPTHGDRLRSRIGEIRAAIAAAPKSVRWRARARIGRRMPWYELPEEHVR